MKALMIGILSLLLVLPLAAQIDLDRLGSAPYSGSGTSLLSLNRISMSHSMGFSAGTTLGGNGYYMSRYTNHLKYAFSKKLDLELDLNFVNFGSTSSSFKLNDDNQSKILPEFRLNYRPSDSVNVSIEFRQGNPWYQDNRPWYERW